MKVLDTPIRLAASRTPRELLLIGHGAACVAGAIWLGDHSWNIYAYAAVTALFAGRFFAGRVLYLSMCIAALALQLAHGLLPGVTLAMKATVLLEILGVSLLLCGPDLVQRFDVDGHGLGPFGNFWRDLSVAQRRHVAWGLHLVGTTGALLHHMWFNLTASHQPVPTWLYVGVAACTGVGLLYLWGRAIAAPAAVVVGGLVAWRLAPYLDDAWRQLHGGWSAHAVPREVWYSAHYTLLACVAAAATAAIAVPWTVRWLRLAAR